MLSAKHNEILTGIENSTPHTGPQLRVSVSPWLFLLEYQLVVLRRHLDLVSRLEVPFQQTHRQRVEAVLLDRPFQWAGAELRVAATFCE